MNTLFDMSEPEQGDGFPGVAVTPEIMDAIADNANIGISVSGGKDSGAMAFATNRFLDTCKHTGGRVLIHADLGMVEWDESLPTCEKLAKVLGLELVVVQRKAGGMMERWETRWQNNLERYRNLNCVKLIRMDGVDQGRMSLTVSESQLREAHPTLVDAVHAVLYRRAQDGPYHFGPEKAMAEQYDSERPGYATRGIVWSV